MDSTYNVVLSTNESTVVTEYVPEKKRSEAYQSETALEDTFIKLLSEQGYEYLQIHDTDALVDNLRKQLERLNKYTFTDKEWDVFYKTKIPNPNESIVDKSRKIQEDFVHNLTRDDGSTMNITIIDKKIIHENSLQVINQYVVEAEKDGAKYG